VAKQGNELIKLLFATKEKMSLVRVEGFQANERLTLRGDLGSGLNAENATQELLKLLGPLFDVGDSLILRKEAWKLREVSGGAQDWDHRVGRVRVSPIEGNRDLIPHPVHHAFAADVDSKSSRVPKRLLELILPASAGAESNLVNEDAQSCSLRIKAVLNALGERES
jgi:hypothetical protein